MLCVHIPTWVTICLRSFLGMRCIGLPLPCHHDLPTIIPTSFEEALRTAVSSRFRNKGSRPASAACCRNQSAHCQKTETCAQKFPNPCSGIQARWPASTATEMTPYSESKTQIPLSNPYYLPLNSVTEFLRTHNSDSEPLGPSRNDPGIMGPGYGP